MSISQIKPVIQEFIQDEQSSLILLKGGWGIGKTYFWQDEIKQAIKQGRVGLPNYAYVSLFGVNSLEELKNTIWASNAEVPDYRMGDSIPKSTSVIKKLAKNLEQIPNLRDYTGGLAGIAMFLTIKDSLICFDDIERKSDGLNIRDLLGLVSLLKEQRNCKVILIMNEGTLSESDTGVFRKHSEKLVDIELFFNPLAEEVFDIVFHQNDRDYDFIKSCCLRLQIKNIRTLQRLKRHIAYLRSFTKNIEQSVQEDIIRTLTLFIWCYFDRDGAAPSLSEVLSYNTYSFLTNNKDKEKAARNERLTQILQPYGYYYADELDRQILKCIEEGYLDGEDFMTHVLKRNSDALVAKNKDEYRQAWELYHQSFEDNEREFLEVLINSFRSNMSYRSLSDTDAVVEVLLKFEREADARELIDDYVETNKEMLSTSVRGYSVDFVELKNEYLRERVSKLWHQVRSDYSMEEVLSRMVKENSWVQEDLDFLSARSVEEYYNYFKQLNSGDPYIYVSRCLNLGNSNIEGNANEALKRIAGECRINKLRIESWFKLNVDEQ